MSINPNPEAVGIPNINPEQLEAVNHATNVKQRFLQTAQAILGNDATPDETQRLGQQIYSKYRRGQKLLVETMLLKKEMQVDQTSWDSLATQLSASAEQHGGAILLGYHTAFMHAAIRNFGEYLPDNTSLNLITESAVPDSALKMKAGTSVNQIVVGMPSKDSPDLYERLHDFLTRATGKKVATQDRATRPAAATLETRKGAPNKPVFLYEAIDRPDLASEVVKVQFSDTQLDMPASPAVMSHIANKPMRVVYFYENEAGQLAVEISDEIASPASLKDQPIQDAMQQVADYSTQIIKSHPQDWVVNRPDTWKYGTNHQDTDPV